MIKKILSILTLLWAFVAHAAAPIRIVAAENFYGIVAQQIGGPYVQVESILKNPQQDPHLFSTTPSIAKAISHANWVIVNGLGYDSWMDNLAASAGLTKDRIINVADLVGKATGSNPHIWYDPKNMLAFANYLTNLLIQHDPNNQSFYHNQQTVFKKDYQQIQDKIQNIRQQYQGAAIIATEPVFNDMAETLGLVMKGQDFQLSIMNDTEPSITAVKDFENQLTHHQVKVLIYNNQVRNPATERMQQLAIKNKIPIIGVSELQPAQQSYAEWMISQLDNLQKALSQVD